MGIPPAPRGVPQVQVAFDIDANGILQVSAMDRTTGREQSLTIQGSATLSEEEVQQMIKDAEEFSDTDRLKREQVEKRNRAEALTYQAERVLREVVLDFGMQFARDRRRRVERLIQELRECLTNNDERGIDITQAELQDEVYELNREAYLYEDDTEETDLLGQIGGTLKRTFIGDDNEYDRYEDSWSRRPAWDDDAWNYDRPRLTGTPPANDYYSAPPPPRYQPNAYGSPGSSDPYRAPARSSWNEPPIYGNDRPRGPGYDRPPTVPNQPPAQNYPPERYGADASDYGNAGRGRSPNSGGRPTTDPWSEPESYGASRPPVGDRNERDWNRPPGPPPSSRPSRDLPPRDSAAAGRDRPTSAPPTGYNNRYDDDWGDEADRKRGG